MKRVILDTDPGCDDALAIMMLEASDQIQIEFMTTVAGNLGIKRVNNNAVHLTKLTGKPTKIYSGSEKPLKRELALASIHGGSGLGGIEVPDYEEVPKGAVEKIVEFINANPNEISIIAVGPLTNIAKAFQIDPSLPGKIKDMIVMGGAITVPGNMGRVAEFNFFVDPDAAKIVFESGIKITLVPIDLCNITPLFREDFKKLEGSRLYEDVYKIMDLYIDKLMEVDGEEGALMYDPLAAYCAINPDAFEYEDMDIVIETEGEYTYGMSVADRRKKTEGKKYNASVATAVDKELFTNDFLDLIRKL